MVEPERIELSSVRCKRTVLATELRSHYLVQLVGIEPTYKGLEHPVTAPEVAAYGHR